ncbi:hypothetical protein PseBG33_1614 [Pseudomonas synxantha BG33R]|uniref:phospholipase effector Tle1 domain-containing protein n=1 Tax=Pseudomonas TaxID=286 RepID=UPI00025FF1F5|nr:MULTISPECIES: DUF2235 domain-containing protein [Pseudomonas]EIK68969.1 hypothetical protein PseBG33_1614 [Pseudomonas synxantha BG33R]QOY73155.1 DUF2235 domain-containing protein [Pseudomonas sp. OST1909]WPN52507.1 DUF2235 domain-containing protein [Pseudomonas sp. P9_2]
MTLDTPVITIRIGLFFDGTGNNALNALAGTPDKGVSYQGAISNIYRLYKYYTTTIVPETLMQTGIYMEGVGTKTNDFDSTLAMAVGVDLPLTIGGYGVFAKYAMAVSKACATIGQLLSSMLPTQKNVNIEFDVFGFSRGATIARHFANMVISKNNSIYLPIAEILKKYDMVLRQDLDIHFLGLFDTVASIWTLNNGQWQDPHDTGNTSGMDIELRLIHPSKVLQIQSMHEYRYNFPLRSVQPPYVELPLPGCHSDIGGSYALGPAVQTEVCRITPKRYWPNPHYDPRAHVVDEINNLRMDPILNVLLEHSSVEYSVLPLPYYQGISRREVKGELQLIAGWVMLDTACHNGCSFDKDAFKADYPIPDDLKPFLRTALIRRNEVSSHMPLTPYSPQELAFLARDYIHISVDWKNVLMPFAPRPLNLLTEPLQQHMHAQLALETHFNGIFGNESPNRPDMDWQRKIFMNAHSIFPHLRLGEMRAENFVSDSAIIIDKVVSYSTPPALPLDHWSLEGLWNYANQTITLDAPGGRIVYRFNSRDLYLVLGPAVDGNHVHFEVKLDGQAPAPYSGSDVAPDGTGTVISKRKYHLVHRTDNTEEQTFSITFYGPKVVVYAFALE